MTHTHGHESIPRNSHKTNSYKLDFPFTSTNNALFICWNTPLLWLFTFESLVSSFYFGKLVLVSMFYLSSIRVVNSNRMTSYWGRKYQYLCKFPRLVHIYPYQIKTIPNDNISTSDNHDSNTISMKKKMACKCSTHGHAIQCCRQTTSNFSSPYYYPHCCCEQIQDHTLHVVFDLIPIRSLKTNRSTLLHEHAQATPFHLLASSHFDKH